ncbi:MAG: P1 family peptidase, partial [Aggregatilineales bacterium]
GLTTADGVMRYLAEHDMGYLSGTGYRVPIVPAAILFDLQTGEQGIYPTAETGYAACENASTDTVEQGCVGAGTGAICGGMLGAEFATKGGIGSASIALDDELIVAAMVAVNAVGDVLNEDGSILGGLRTPPDGNSFRGTLNALKDRARLQPPASRENTVIGLVATNAKLSKAHCTKVAQMAHDGIARAINPAHTMYDGDTIFALATGDIPADTTIIGAYAAEAMSMAIRNAMRHATTLHNVRAWND